MLKLLSIAVLSLRLPIAETFEPYNWQPEFTKPSELHIVESTVAIVTHGSRHFDPLGTTRNGVNQVIATMKRSGLPVVYLHDRHNSSNPGWMYLYDDWNPTAFLASDVGHFDIEFSDVAHVVCLGGYFGQCERSTVADGIRLWRRDGGGHDLRITQIVDGTFCVNEYVRFNDPYYSQVRDLFRKDLRSRHPKAVISVQQIIEQIDDERLVVEFLKRQLPTLPTRVNVFVDAFGQYTSLRNVAGNAMTLTFAYRRSDDFLIFETPPSELP
ncbi:MAG: hypothetical protein GY903_30240 [Fuerstiella sp.]|nr:hypothetical protein [Fuerstiella sp.]MCP4858774.1 hypothetical protein [Fuerstiella sp.]